MSVVEEHMPPGAADDRHFNTLARRVIYVLEGTLQLEQVDEVSTIASGDWIEIPPMHPHRMRNTGTVCLRLLLISRPAPFTGRVVVA